jgi:hypothetical protein
MPTARVRYKDEDTATRLKTASELDILYPSEAGIEPPAFKDVTPGE